MTDKSKKGAENQATRKIVIRRLPPSLTKDQFLNIVSPLPEHDLFTYHGPDLSLGQYGFCRAYICFKTDSDVFSFKDRFDNYVFVDAKSNEYPALVEFAPFQRFYKPDPINVPKKDSKCNTIHNDADYVKFLENMDKPSGDALPSCEAILEELESRERDKAAMGLSGNAAAFNAPKMTTPLLEFMKKKKEDKKREKDKEKERRRDRDDDKRKRKDEYYYNSKSKSGKSSKNNNSGAGGGNKPEKSGGRGGRGKKSEAARQTGSADSNQPQIKIMSKPASNNNASENTTAPAPPNKPPHQSSKPKNNEPRVKEHRGGNKNQSGASASSKAENQGPTGDENKSSNAQKQPEKNREAASSAGSTNENKSGGRGGKRPPMQIYNPAERIRQRQQKNPN